jgi:hypothetical protein
MSSKINVSDRLSLFNSYFTLNPEELKILQKNLNPENFIEIYKKLKIERQRVRNTEHSLDTFNKHNKFRRIYQEELILNYQKTDGKDD